MTNQCDNCKELDKRMIKLINRVLLKAFVQMVTIETEAQHSETSMRETLTCLNGSAKTLLKELGEND